MRTERWRPLLELPFRPLATRAGMALLLVSGTMFAVSVLAEGAGKPESKSGPVNQTKKPPSTAVPASRSKVVAPLTPATMMAKDRRVALTTAETRLHTTLKPNSSTQAKITIAPAPKPIQEDPVARAIRTIKQCRSKYASVNDYCCTFYKRERIDGRMTPLFVMSMKARSTPRSIYFKFESPYKGREAIYVEGRNEGKILAHDVGLTRFLTGTLELEPTSARAMENNRHPITEAGIDTLIDTLYRRWKAELRPEESLVLFDPDMTIGSRRCLMIEAVHPRRQPGFVLHKVRLFIDSEHCLPIRFEGYDWPREEGGPAPLVEEYSYINLKLNVGLDDSDFDPANRQYAFGRF